MTNEIMIHRRRAAEAACAYLSGKLSWDQFMEFFANNEDELIGDLIDLIEHEPQRGGGLFGVNEKVWSQYQSQLSSAIAALESSAAAEKCLQLTAGKHAWQLASLLVGFNADYPGPAVEGQRLGFYLESVRCT